MTALFIGPAGHVTALSQASAALERQGFDASERLTAGGMEVIVCPPKSSPEPVVAYSGDDFAAVSGTLIFRRRRGRAALELLLREFTGDWKILEEALGPFVLAVKRGDVLHLATDRAGASPLFRGNNGCFSTSFFALAETQSRVTFSTQETREYVLTGVPLGDDTMLAEIRKTPLGATVAISSGRPEVVGGPIPPDGEDRRPFADLIEDVDVRLDSYIDDVLQAFDGRVRCPITSGYDARYVFALLRRRGVTPEVLIYTGFGDDTRAAQRVADVEGVHLEIIDPSRLRSPTPDEFAEVARSNFLEADGWRQQGIFHSGVQGLLAADRTAGGHAFLTGNAGEVFRNFFMLRNRPYTARQVAEAMYAKFNPAVLPGDQFAAYVDGVTHKIDELVGRTGKLDRTLIDWLYPYFRCRSWFGRHIALYNRMGPHLMPFYDTRVTGVGVTVPARYKQSGRFEAALIARARPAVAAVRSQYGHDFAEEPPLRRRIRDHAKSAVPPSLRPRLYGGRQRLAADAGGYLAAPFIAAALPSGVGLTTGLLRTEHLTERKQRSRLLTMEYMAQHLRAAVATEWSPAGA